MESYRADDGQQRGGLGPFLVCLIVHMTFPLIPLIIEFVLTNDITPQSLTIAVAMYSMAIGSSSKVKFLFFLMVGVSILFSAAYGYMLLHLHVEVNGGQAVDHAIVDRLKQYSYWVIAGVFLIHAIERFSRHVVNDEPFGI
jgi:hypothetical protein